MPATLNSKAAAELASTAYNPVYSAWIPVRDTANVPHTMSLLELFTRAESLTELDLRPHERVSVMRLLVCITQAAIGAPEDEGGWNDFGQGAEREVTPYLRMHREAFALFGAGPRFLQVKPKGAADPVPVSKLLPHLATGSNPTNFDHAGGSGCALSPAELTSLRPRARKRQGFVTRRYGHICRYTASPLGFGVRRHATLSFRHFRPGQEDD